LQTIDNVEKYYKFSAKGFPCTVCDADKSQFLRFDEQKKLYNIKFCRGIIKNTLPFVQYTRVLFKKYVNMLVFFLNNCDFKGRYVPQPIDKKMILPNKNQDLKAKECMHYVNSPHWVDHCAQYCLSFNSERAQEFFIPNVYSYMKITNFIKSKLTELRFAQNKDLTWSLPDDLS